MNKKEEVKAINIQLIALIIVLFSTIISILITYNQKLNLEKKETIFDSKESFDITLFNRILIVVLSFIFLYVNIKLYNLSKKEGEDLKSYILQIIASILAIISALIALYVVNLSTNESIVDVENPVI
jgi:uncharacterized membrane protein